MKSITDLITFKLKKEYPNAKVGELFFLTNPQGDYIENNKGKTIPLEDVTEEWFDIQFQNRSRG